MQMARNMKANGKTINNMVKGLKLGLMGLCILGYIPKEKNKEKASLCGKIMLLTMENLIIIILKAKELITGMMEENIKDNGLIIKCTGLAYFHGQIIKNMKDTTIKIKKMAMEFLHGLMENNIKVIGKTENNMEKVS